MRTRTLPLLIAGLITSLATFTPMGASGQSTVNFSAAPGQRNVMDTSNDTLEDGNMVKIGYFNSGFDVMTAAADLAALDAAWNEFATTTIQTIFGQEGRFADNDSTSDTSFNSEQIWFWIFETSNDGDPDPSFSNVTGYGLFTSASGNWLFPDQGELPPNNTTSVNSSEVDTAAYGSFDGNSLMLQPIPEPAVITFLLTGIGLFLVWGKRFKS